MFIIQRVLHEYITLVVIHSLKNVYILDIKIIRVNIENIMLCANKIIKPCHHIHTQIYSAQSCLKVNFKVKIALVFLLMIFYNFVLLITTRGVDSGCIRNLHPGYALESNEGGIIWGLHRPLQFRQVASTKPNLCRCSTGADRLVTMYFLRVRTNV